MRDCMIRSFPPAPAQEAGEALAYDGGTDLSLLDALPAGTVDYLVLASDGVDNHGHHRRPSLLGVQVPVHVAITKGGEHGAASHGR